MEVQYPLVFFTLFLCLSSGMLLFQGVCAVRGLGTKKFHTVMLGVELAVLAIGGFSSFLHLHHWERIFNGFGHLTSGITQELIGIVASVAVLAVLFGVLRKAGEGDRALPVWCGALAIAVGVIMGFVCAHSYYMPARPAWSNFTLYLYYYASELVLGAAGTWLVAAALREDAAVGELLAKLTCAMGAVSAVAVVVAGFYWTTISFGDVGYSFHTTDPTAALPSPAEALASPFGGAEAALFWGGAVVVGSLVALAAGALGWKKPQMALPTSVCALACALVGGVCFRVVLYAVGVGFYVYF